MPFCGVPIPVAAEHRRGLRSERRRLPLEREESCFRPPRTMGSHLHGLVRFLDQLMSEFTKLANDRFQEVCEPDQIVSDAFESVRRVGNLPWVILLQLAL